MNVRKITRKTEEQDGFPTTLNERNRIRLTVPLIGELNRLVLEKLTHQVNIQQIQNNLQIRYATLMPPGCGVTPTSVNLDVGRIVH